jgi:tRNA(Ile)-lysidine synthase TilS/MesJ
LSFAKHINHDWREHSRKKEKEEKKKTKRKNNYQLFLPQNKEAADSFSLKAAFSSSGSPAVPDPWPKCGHCWALLNQQIKSWPFLFSNLKYRPFSHSDNETKHTWIDK